MKSGTAKVKAAMPGVADGFKLVANKDSIKAADDETKTQLVTYKLYAVDRNGVPTGIFRNDQEMTVTVTLDKNLNKTYSFVDWDGSGSLAPIADSQGAGDGAGLTKTFDLKNDGRATFAVGVPSRAGTYEVKVTASGYSTVTSTLEVTPDDPAVVAFTKSDVDVLRASDKDPGRDGELFDQFGNKVAKAGIPVTIKVENVDTGDSDGVTVNGKKREGYRLHR